MSVSEHILVTRDQRDLGWLKTALETAIAIEHSTLPLYLAAMYSLRIQNYTAYNLVRSVAMEEMVHMATASNILAALGGAPSIKGLDPSFPSAGLPGGAEPDLSVRLAKLSKPQLKNFMRVEMPWFLLPEAFRHELYPTISRLYNGIVEAVRSNADQVRAAVKAGGAANQVGDNIGVATITWSDQHDPLEQIEAAIDQILEQGEGSPSRTLHADPESEGEESHYCKFAELYYGHRYEEPDGVELTGETESRFFTGYRIPFPDVVNTLSVPSDGYSRLLARDPNGSEVEKSLLAFDQAYSEMLSGLDEVWNGPASASWPTLGAAVTAMGHLRVLACFGITPHQVPPNLIASLSDLYPEEQLELATYADLKQPVFYGPRFRNLNANTASN